jgi:hypothetical protein
MQSAGSMFICGKVSHLLLWMFPVSLLGQFMMQTTTSFSFLFNTYVPSPILEQLGIVFWLSFFLFPTSCHWNLLCKLYYEVVPSDANLVITWSSNPHINTPIPGKPSKSGLIGVWHKDKLYLGTSTIGNGKPPPNEYWFANEKDDAKKTVVLR